MERRGSDHRWRITGCPLLLYIALIWDASALLCPHSIHCGNLNTPTTTEASCALLKPPYVTVSITGCDYTDEYSFCSFDDLMEKYLTIKEGSSQTPACSWMNSTQIHEDFKAQLPDLVKNAQYNIQNLRLKTGSHPKLCDTDSDCELVNGDHAKCRCSTFGKSYCSLSLGDSFMGPMYTYAAMGDAEGVDYFLSYQRSYIFQFTKLTCNALFIENELLVEATSVLLSRNIQVFYKAALKLAISALLLAST